MTGARDHGLGIFLICCSAFPNPLRLFPEEKYQARLIGSRGLGSDTAGMQIANQLHRTHRTPWRVFIVEDSSPVLERLEEMVGNIAGVHCAGSAGTADAALRGITATRPDAVILDVVLAQGNGFEVLRALTAAALPTEIYMFSNLASEPYRRLAQRLGAAAFFDKSSQTDEMRTLLAQRAGQRTIPSH